MGVDTKHSEYIAYQPLWEKARAVVAGQEAIHEGGKKYLPELSGQDKTEYEAYRDRTLFYEATSRTVDGLTGLVFRKPPIFELPPSMEDFARDVTLDGTSLQGFAEMAVEEVITAARGGIFVDYPSLPAGKVSVAAAQALNIRAFFRFCKAEEIINWSVKQINNRTVLSQVRLMEVVAVPVDEFDVEHVDQIRVLDLDETNLYRQRLYRKQKNKGLEEWVQFGPDILPLMRGARLDFIPFVFLGIRDTSHKVSKPPLNGLVNANISHYQSTADLEHGAHFTGLPTAVVTGHELETGETLKIGSTSAWAFPRHEAKAYFLEFEGKGLESLEKRVQKKEEYMAFLGARMLLPEKRMVETAEAAGIQRIGENSILSSISQAVSQGLTLALEIAARWYGIEPKVSVTLNRDFMPMTIDPAMVRELFSALQGGAISHETFFENLQRGEIIGSERTHEEEVEAIQSGANALPFMKEEEPE